MGKIIEEAEAKQLMLDILVKFSAYCEKKNLRYYLSDGTLLGAICHNGYIPWDNDVDVCMPRTDYEKLCQEIKKEKIESYIDCLQYQEIRTFPFIKLIDNRTVLKEHFLVTEDSLGIYIDVFPLDGLPEESRGRKRIARKMKLYAKMYAFANYRFGTGANFWAESVKIILYPFSKFISNGWVCERWNRICRNYDYEESQWVGIVVWGSENCFFRREWFSAEKALFEGHEFVIPGGYDAVLRKEYGDYMTLPPECDRVVHFYEARWK